jgi:uncharacterized membrane-anchored protein YhcB (DUF1043 family)
VFIVGLLLGTLVGVVIMSLVQINKHNDTYLEEMNSSDEFNQDLKER